MNLNFYGERRKTKMPTNTTKYKSLTPAQVDLIKVTVELDLSDPKDFTSVKSIDKYKERLKEALSTQPLSDKTAKKNDECKNLNQYYIRGWFDRLEDYAPGEASKEGDGSIYIPSDKKIMDFRKAMLDIAAEQLVEIYTELAIEVDPKTIRRELKSHTAELAEKRQRQQEKQCCIII